MQKVAYQCKNVVASSHTTHNLSRYELLEWINSSLDQKMKKVESLCSGAVYCQFMSTLFPGCISLKKIKFEATQEHEFINNLKQLQIAFRKVGCDKDIPINKLIKGRFQENFEFLQWFRRFFDANLDYVHMPQPKEVTKQQDLIPEKVSSDFTSNSTGHSFLKKQSAKDLKSQLAELNERVDIISKEKDFYYEKLRNIEILCTELTSDSEDPQIDTKTLISKVLEELYATEDGEEKVEEKTY